MEHIECFTKWIPGEEMGYHSPGEYFKLSGECSECDHQWTVPGEIQITDLLKERLARNHELLTHQPKITENQFLIFQQ